jgi:hypothetical protein
MNRFVACVAVAFLALALTADLALAQRGGGRSGGRPAGGGFGRPAGGGFGRPAAARPRSGVISTGRRPGVTVRSRVIVVNGRRVVVTGDAPSADAEVADGEPAEGEASAEEPALPEQTVRYIRVVNNSGQDLTVYVKLRAEDKPSWWKIPAGVDGYLSDNGEKFAASEVYLWATSGTTQWRKNKSTPLVLVPTPYQASEIATYTYTFNP